MEKRIIKVPITWTEENYGCMWGDKDLGVVVVTASSIDKLKRDFTESLNLHIQGCVKDGDDVPEYLVKGDYDLEFDLDASALIRNAEEYTTMAVISRISGINQKQLSHYANGLKHPRPLQIQRIKTALSAIGSELIALS